MINICMIFVMMSFYTYTNGQMAPVAWNLVEEEICNNVLYYPIAHPSVTSISIINSHEELVDLREINHPRIQPLATFDPKYHNTYDEHSKVRRGVYEKLLTMLDFLPNTIGIAYFEGFRPLYKQKEYFDNKLKEILETIPDKEQAYEETTKHVSPFIDNIPTHATGAAIDMTLFSTENNKNELLDMGKFDVIFGPNDQQETFSINTTKTQRNNRMLLLQAATNAGLVNYGFEWWHYSYGDKMWVFVKHQNNALYGLAVSEDDPILSINKADYLNNLL